MISARDRLAIATASLALLVACNGADTTRQVAASTSSVGTMMGSAVVGTTIDSPVHLVVSDEAGAPIPNVAVHFVPSGGGRVSLSDVISDNAGVVETRWTLGTKSGMQTLQAEARDMPPQLFTANAIPDRAASVQLNVAGAMMSLLGDTLRIDVRTMDRYANPVTTPATYTVESGAEAVAMPATGYVVARARGSARIRVQVDTAHANLVVVVDPATPTVESIAPDTLVPGAKIVISGANFALIPEAVELTVGGLKAIVTKVSGTRIEATLAAATAYPCAATGQQPVRVTIAGHAAISNATFRTSNRVTLARGESQNLLDAQQVRCTELVEPPTAQRAKYIVAVLNTSVTAATFSGFELRASGGGLMAGQIGNAQTAGSNLKAAMPAARVASINLAILQEKAEEQGHGDFLERQRAMVNQVGSPVESWKRIRAARSNIASLRVTPSLGDTILMKAIYSSCSVGRDVRARVVFIGAKSLIMEDVTAPRAGQMDAQYRAVGQEYDGVQYPLLKNNIGDPLAMDATLGGDGRVTMLFTRYVNDSLPGIQGYATACNFYPKATFPPSNEDEVFYARVAGASEDPESWRRSMRSTVLHESKHLASFAERLSHNLPFEESWLEESTARIAEELYSRTFSGGGSWKGNSGYAASVRCEIYQCDDRPLMMWKHFSVLHQFFTGVDTLTPIGAAASGDFTFYASGWSLVRWAADHYASNEAQWLKDLVRGGPAVGLANLAQRSGHPVEEMLADWSLANAVDDKTALRPAREQLSFPSWNMPDMMAGLAAADPVRFGDIAPLHIRAFSFGTVALPVVKLRAFSSSYFSFEGQQTGSQVFELRGENGGALPASLRVAIIRVE
ncbi:MAG: hypothetical protein M3Y64_02040 [Gemmatimonadota bacterium]|nr:hypothetical protein [Gemmatimonadota bacterium]